MYVRASTLCYLHSQTFWMALTASVDRRAEIRIECPFCGVTKYGRVWRKDAGKRGLECGMNCARSGSKGDYTRLFHFKPIDLDCCLQRLQLKSNPLGIGLV